MSETTNTAPHRPTRLDETLAVLRAALRAALPGVRLSVRNGRGTGYGWINVRWTDGPTAQQVRAVTDPIARERCAHHGGILTERRPSPTALEHAEQVVAANPALWVRLNDPYWREYAADRCWSATDLT